MSHGVRESALRDVAFTTATPFTEDRETIRHDALADNLRFLKEAGARLFIPCGNTGEYDSLTDDERVAVVRTHVETVSDEGTVIGGLAGSTKQVRSLAERYEESGADGLMVMPPDHTYVHERGLKEYYHRIADVTDLDIVLYKRGPAPAARTLASLAEVDNVVGVKYARNDLKELAALTADVPDLVWLNGAAERYAPAFALEGAVGFTTGLGNFAPEISLALMAALREEDWERARRLREVVRPIEDLREETGAENSFASANNVPVVKYGLQLAGQTSGPVREPLVGLSEEDRRRTEEYYERIRNADL